MATAYTFDQLFTAYYSQFRADSDVPASTDDEYTVGIRLANEAINYWENYDNVYWRELFATLQTASTGATTTITTGTKTYAAPTAFKEAGGNVKVLDSNSNIIQTYPIVEPQQVQFLDENADYAYFTQAVTGLFTLHINPAPTSSLNGKSIDYVYYKTATLITGSTSTTEMANPYFIVHRMLANQFRASRNPYYASAKSDAENSIKVMQMHNNSGIGLILGL
jgi:hypothetical protein